jgi:hypothetical protein
VDDVRDVGVEVGHSGAADLQRAPHRRAVGIGAARRAPGYQPMKEDPMTTIIIHGPGTKGDYRVVEQHDDCGLPVCQRIDGCRRAVLGVSACPQRKTAASWPRYRELFDNA